MIKIIYRYLYAYEFFSNGKSNLQYGNFIIVWGKPYSEIGGMNI